MEIQQLVGIVAIATFLYSYIKDQYKNGKAIGQLEQRISALESNNQKINDLVSAISEIKIQLARLEEKIDRRT